MKFPTGRRGRRGQVMLLIALLMTFLVSLAGLAVDVVYAYAVRSQLAISIDSVALAAMRALTGGTSYSDQAAEIQRISDLMLTSNFPTGSLLSTNVGFSSGPTVYGPTIPSGAPSMFQVDPDVEQGVRELRVEGQATVPTFFMRVFGVDTLQVRAGAVAARRDVNVMLVLDRSGSLNLAGAWEAVQASSVNFLSFFDNNGDRLGIVSYGSGARVDLPLNFGFKTDNVGANIINSMASTGGTNSALGLWFAYGELLRIADPSALNVIVLFTDGQPTALPARYRVRTSGKMGGTTGNDNPFCDSVWRTAVSQAVGTISGSTWSPTDVATLNRMLASAPPVTADVQAVTGCSNLAGGAMVSNVEFLWDETYGLPTQWTTTYGSSFGCSLCGTTSFTRTFDITTGPYPTYTSLEPLMFSAWNGGSNGPTRANRIIGGARNIALSVAEQAGREASLNGIVLYTIGLGVAGLTENEDIMLRVSNDKDSPAFDTTRPEGEYIFAPTVDELAAAFEKVRGHVIRLTR
jgi:Mg-chelatase subunit ChlD